MELENLCVETSQDLPRIYSSFKNNDSSSEKLTFGTDATGIMDLPERGIEIREVEESKLHKEGLIHGSLKSRKEMDFFRESSSIKPEFIYYPKIVKFPRKEIILDSLRADIIPLKLNLLFSTKVENLIIHDSIFRKFICEIERSLNEFIELEHVKLENRIFFEEDWEIPDYEKLVLSLNFKGIPFKREMLLWKMLNTRAYERIKSMILYSSGEQLRRIKELKKKFFIKLEM